ncbi:hypothetical protein FMUND_10803 [Fusarium mundagurra]|uniref:Uncharacterized protein n=1 Tax=Fusarium mundagurra TaxID=1567541 RepID=A0A8H6D8G1_9HYPO|nr:hypothetical protein FMUND_10803 [Fusarium mundagurra]
MAEAFGIAGSAFGTVSLGIQLFTEITKYLDSVEGRDEDLERAKNYARDFQSSLIALRTWASVTGFSDTDLERAINQGQTNCAGAINTLSATVAELKGQDPIPNSRTSKVRNLYVKLKYPFKKQNLENLEKQLFNTISVLKFALTILQVKSTYITQMSVQSMERALFRRLPRVPDPDSANYDNMLPGRDEDIAEAAPESAIRLPNPTSTMPVSGIRSTRYQNGTMWTMTSFCVCRKNFKRRERRQWGPFILENEMSFTDYHSPGCPLSTQEPLEQQSKQTLKFPIPFTGRRWRAASQFSLFFTAVKDFPEISNYLEYGQLSRLIVMEDGYKVQDLLEKYPSSIKEINHLGQTPIHIAVQTQNAKILSLLVNHADHKVLNTKDNNGHYAIDHAIDSLCHALKPGKEPGSTVCNGCEVLDVLLRSELAIFTCSVRRAMHLPWIHDIPICIEGQKNIIRNLASRRKELKALAQRELTPVERQNLRFCQAGTLDQKAAQTQRLLEAKRCHVPVRLKVYDSAESPEDSKSIYLLISHGDVAESALQSGFFMPTTLFDDEYWIDNAVVRHFTFLILDLRHTCCSLGNACVIKVSGPLSTGDRHEIEEEDRSRLELLEQLVSEFGRERGNYADLKSFAREYWVPRMEAVHHEIESYVLTESQRQSAEAVGVVWECYGPQLPCDDSLTVDTKNEEEILQDQVLYS